MTVSYNFRQSRIDHKDADGNITRTEVYYTCDTDHWNFWGPSGGKSKKNDHVFYNACKKRVIEHYTALLAEKGVKLRRVKTWADNCPGQFGCVQTYSDIATADAEHGILASQYFAEKYCFKSVVDSVGKVCLKICECTFNLFCAQQLFLQQLFDFYFSLLFISLLHELIFLHAMIYHAHTYMYRLASFTSSEMERWVGNGPQLPTFAARMQFLQRRSGKKRLQSPRSLTNMKLNGTLSSWLRAH